MNVYDEDRDGFPHTPEDVDTMAVGIISPFMGKWPDNWDESPELEAELERRFAATTLASVHVPERLDLAHAVIRALAPGWIFLVEARQESLKEEYDWMARRLRQHKIGQVAKIDLPIIEHWGAVEVYRPLLEVRAKFG